MRINTSQAEKGPSSVSNKTLGLIVKTKKFKLGWEDIILLIAIIIILVSWIRNEFSSEQALAYLGFTATGGIWGVFSGKYSK